MKAKSKLIWRWRTETHAGWIRGYQRFIELQILTLLINYAIKNVADTQQLRQHPWKEHLMFSLISFHQTWGEKIEIKQP